LIISSGIKPSPLYVRVVRSLKFTEAEPEVRAGMTENNRALADIPKFSHLNNRILVCH
jgi:hypothetical protein